MRFTGTNLETARKGVEDHVNHYEELIGRQARASEALEQENRLMDAVTDFMEKDKFQMN